MKICMLADFQLRNLVSSSGAALSWLIAHPPAGIAMIYILMSLVTFAFYVHDKHAAQKGEWRTPETTLHLLELLCGWPGALLAQYRIRHKNRKFSYQLVFWTMVILNLTALVKVTQLGQ